MNVSVLLDVLLKGSFLGKGTHGFRRYTVRDQRSLFGTRRLVYALFRQPVKLSPADLEWLYGLSDVVNDDNSKKPSTSLQAEDTVFYPNREVGNHQRWMPF